MRIVFKVFKYPILYFWLADDTAYVAFDKRWHGLLA